MLTGAIATVCLLSLIAELWLGYVVTGWQGEQIYIDRSEKPGQFWLIFALHASIGIGLPLLSYAAGV